MKSKIGKSVLFLISCIVIFCVTYALILPAITMSKDTTDDTADETEITGSCEEFQISVKFEGMGGEAFHNFVVSAIAKQGYYLEISREDTGDVVKKLYFENSYTLDREGIYTWKVTDLETKDKDGNPISYRIKERNYWQTPDTPVSVEALLTHNDHSTEAIAVTKSTEQSEAVLEHNFTFGEGDILQIWNRYNESAGEPQKEKVTIKADFEGLDSSTLADMAEGSGADNDEGYCLEICYPDTGGIAKKLYLSEAGASEKEGEYIWEITDLETKYASGQPVLYTIKEKNYKAPKNSILAINAELTDWEDLSVIQDTEHDQASLSPNISFKENDILKITNQYQPIKRTKKIRICTHLNGLKPEELRKLIQESTPKNKDGFYIEIKEKTVARNSAYVKDLYLSDASSVSSDSTTVSWDIEDLPVLDDLNEPISYQVSQYNYPVNNYAETVVSANITRSDSTVSDIGTTPDTEHAVAGLDDVSFDSDLDTTVDTIDIDNRYTNDFSMTCYDKNGKPIENAKVTVKTPEGEVIATGMTAAAGSGVAAGTVVLSGLALPGGATAVLTVAGSTIAITLTAALLYSYYKNGSNVIRENPTKPDQPVTPDDPGKKDDEEEMKYITLTLKKEWKRSENQAPKGAKVKFIVYKSSNGSTDTEKIAEVVMNGKTDSIEVRPWEAQLKNLEGGIVKNKQVIKQYTYYVKEEPLEGYETTYKGTAGEDLSLVPILVSGKGEKAVWACTGTDGTVTAVNNEKYKLPKTGGSGTWKYTVVGSLLITISLLYRYIRGRKRERRR